MRLSIAMMVKNESKHLKKCLDSLKPIINSVESELIIVDTGSEDNTVEIAKQFTDKVYFHEWINDFAYMRNITISYCTGDWLLILDADEVLENPETLINFINSKQSDSYNTVNLKIKSYTTNDEDESSCAVLSLPRLFKNSEDFMYTGAIHEQPKIKLPIYDLDVTLLHYGYISTDKELMERKFERNTEILKKEIEKDPENHYYWHQLSVSYGMHKDYKEALKYALKTYEIAQKKKLDISRCMYVYNHLAITYFWNNKFKEAEDICLKAIKVSDEYIDLFYILGKCQNAQEKFKEAIQSFERYLKLYKNYDKYKGSRDITTTTYTLKFVEEVYLILGYLYGKQRDYDIALGYIEKIKSEEILKMGSNSIPLIFVEAGKFKELKRFYINRISGKNEHLDELFTVYIDKALETLEEEKRRQVLMLFSDTDSDYSCLNRMRLLEIEGTGSDISNDIKDKLAKIDLNKKLENYGDIIYYIIKNGYSIHEMYPNLKEINLRIYLNYLQNKKDICQLIYKYLENEQKAGNLSALRVNKTLAGFVLIQDNLENEEYKKLFARYIDEGITYLCEVYNPQILDKQMEYDLKSDEDVFLMYMYAAKKVKDTDKVQYIRILRKALKIYPQMKRGIELLLQEIKEIVNNTGTRSDNQTLLRAEGNKVKENIKKLINKNEINNALELLSEYEKIVPDDVEIYSIKAVIAMMQGKFDSAEKILEEGLRINGNDFDLLYNAAYLYQLKEQYQKSISYYERAIKITSDFNTRNEISSVLEMLYSKCASADTGSLPMQDSNTSVYSSPIENSRVVPGEKPKTSIVILTYNNLEYNKLCINSIRKFTKKGTYEIIIVDNNSTDGTAEWLKQQRDIKLILNKENVGFPKGCNQGIEIADKDNDILLLNNDTIVTPNWLDNLKECLYSDEKIGAVGAVTNSCSNYQAIPIEYKNIDEMIEFSKKINVKSPDKWEERLRLVGFCMLIKNEVIKKVGLLDEIFTPGNFEDDDYSFRIRKAGYKLILCKNAFIHHFGSVSFGKKAEKYVELLNNNRKKFMKKWGFDAYYIGRIRKDITQFIAERNEGGLNILHIGCEGAGTLLDIKNTIPDANLYGIEPVKEAFLDTVDFARIEVGGIDKIEAFDKSFFNYVIITPLNEIENEIVSILKSVKDYVRNDGYLLITVTNNRIVNSEETVRKFENVVGKCFTQISGTDKNWIISIQKTDGSMTDVKRVRNEAIAGISSNGNSREKSIADDFSNKKQTIQNLINSGLIKDAEKEINDYEKFMHDDVEVISMKAVIAIMKYELDTAENLLKQGLIIDTTNFDLLYNLAYVYQLKNNFHLSRVYCKAALESARGEEEKQAVMQMLDSLPEETMQGEENNFEADKSNSSKKVTVLHKSDLARILKDDTEHLKTGEQMVKRLLRRIENNVETEKNINSLRNCIFQNNFDAEIIKEIILDCGIDKELLFNIAGIIYNQKQLPNKALMLFKEAYKLNTQNRDTIYNIAFVLHQQKLDKNALEFLNEVDLSPNDYEILELKKLILEAL